MPAIKNAIYWGVGAIALIALAGPMPELATGLVVVILVGVVLLNYQKLLPLVQPPK